jgi:hypothetical protein
MGAPAGRTVRLVHARNGRHDTFVDVTVTSTHVALVRGVVRSGGTEPRPTRAAAHTWCASHTVGRPTCHTWMRLVIGRPPGSTTETSRQGGARGAALPVVPPSRLRTPHSSAVLAARSARVGARPALFPGGSAAESGPVVADSCTPSFLLQRARRSGHKPALNLPRRRRGGSSASHRRSRATVVAALRRPRPDATRPGSIAMRVAPQMDRRRVWAISTCPLRAARRHV